MGRRRAAPRRAAKPERRAAVPWAVQPENLCSQKAHILQTVDEPSCLAW